jgi:hypothetical protein
VVFAPFDPFADEFWDYRHHGLLRNGHEPLVSSRAFVVGTSHFLRGILHGLDDVLVARAPTQVTFDCVSDFRLARIRVAAEQIGCRHHHSRRAISTLKSVLFPKAFLDRMEFVPLSQSLDGGDLIPVSLDRENGTGFHGLTIHQDGAGAAKGTFASNMGTGQSSNIADVMYK